VRSFLKKFELFPQLLVAAAVLLTNAALSQAASECYGYLQLEEKASFAVLTNVPNYESVKFPGDCLDLYFKRDAVTKATTDLQIQISRSTILELHVSKQDVAGLISRLEGKDVGGNTVSISFSSDGAKFKVEPTKY
jgi:hypothetical protein